MPNKPTLIKRYNELRAKQKLPPATDVTMTAAQLEDAIYQLETPTDKKPADTPPTTAELLKKLNVLRTKLVGAKPLKSWKESRDKLEKTLAAAQLAVLADPRVKVKKLPPAIAKGANTLKKNTDQHKNPHIDAVKRMDKREARQKTKSRKESAKAIALWAGFGYKTVLDYMEAKDITRPTLAGDELKADIKKWVAVKAEVMPRKKGRAPDPLKAWADAQAKGLDLNPRAVLMWAKVNKQDPTKGLTAKQVKLLKAFIKDRPKVGGHGPRKSAGLTPQALATLTGKDPRSVRIKLRTIEEKIPKAWRIQGERWGFKNEHKDDIVKMIKGD